MLWVLYCNNSTQQSVLNRILQVILFLAYSLKGLYGLSVRTVVQVHYSSSEHYICFHQPPFCLPYIDSPILSLIGHLIPVSSGCSWRPLKCRSLIRSSDCGFRRRETEAGSLRIAGQAQWPLQIRPPRLRSSSIRHASPANTGDYRRNVRTHAYVPPLRVLNATIALTFKIRRHS